MNNYKITVASRPRICLIGAGNVATHLGCALAEKADIVQVVSRHIDTASRLCSLIGGECEPVASISELRSDADFYLLAVNDDALHDIVASTPDFPGIWAHTSGSVPMEIFTGEKSRFGVFYPLQTFTRDVSVNMPEVPFFIEGSSAQVTESLQNLAREISSRVEFADSIRRRQLHVAAVFACNYANLMWVEADNLLRREGLDITYLMPLLKATLAKIENISPYEAMTGPARRGDREVIEKHLALLEGRQKEIYRMLADTILEKYHHN